MVLGALFGAKEIIEVGEVGRKKTSAISTELFGYDFVGLSIKIVIIFGVGIIIDKIHFAIVGTSGLIASITGALGFSLPSENDEPQMFKALFSEEGFQGIKFWDIIKFLVITVVVLEMISYIAAQKKLGGEASPITLAVFGIIIFGLSIYTVPELLQKLQSRLNNKESFV